MDATIQRHSVKQGNACAIKGDYAAPWPVNVWEGTDVKMQINAILTFRKINMMCASCAYLVICIVMYA